MSILKCDLVLNSTLLEHLINETKAGRMKWKFMHVSYIYKSDAFSFSFNIKKESGLIKVMLYVAENGTDLELYTPYDKEWAIANKLKDVIIASLNNIKE